MIYIVVGVICLILAICSAVILAIGENTSKGKMAKMVTSGFNNNEEVALSDALENLEVCNGYKNSEEKNN
jgi:hypothetical protein